MDERADPGCARCKGTGRVLGKDGPCRCVGQVDVYAFVDVRDTLSDAATDELETVIRRELAAARAPRTALDARTLAILAARGATPTVTQVTKFAGVDADTAARVCAAMTGAR